MDRVTAALTAPDSYLWFPQLTYDLARTEWQRLEEETGITQSEYGTERVILNDTNAPRNIIYTLLIKNQVEDVKGTISIELLPKTVTDQYKESGVSFYTLEEFLSKGHIRNQILDCLTGALNIIRQVPSLFATVACQVKSIHLIKLESDDYDVSFSEPNIPFSIFVSVPQKKHLANSLRVAEAIVHEATHLQLTLIEKIVPLVFNTGNEYYSPWRAEYRTAGGVLHALYVFRVVESFFRELLRRNLFSEQNADYLNERKREICVQIDEIHHFSDCPDLTLPGKIFVQNLIKPDINTKGF
ncbi:MAG: HEXXH motif-containing putative peptide modification protein [Pyrinomonadaceae bacterium]